MLARVPVVQQKSMNNAAACISAVLPRTNRRSADALALQRLYAQ
jgi:hypothetical protein